MRILVFVRPGSAAPRNPSDALALEYALRLKDDGHADEIAVFGIGPAAIEADLRADIAAGADRALRIGDESLEDRLLCDSALAQVVASVARRELPDLLIAGDDDSGVMFFVSEMLGRPLASSVCSIGRSNDKLILGRRLEKTTQTVLIAPPAIVLVSRGEPLRYPRHADRLRSFDARIVTLSYSDLGLEGAPDSRLRLVAVTGPKPGAKIYPIAGSGNHRVLDLYLGGVGGAGEKAVLEGDADALASKAADLIMARID